MEAISTRLRQSIHRLRAGRWRDESNLFDFHELRQDATQSADSKVKNGPGRDVNGIVLCLFGILEYRLKRGVSRHEAIHAIAYEFNLELFPVLKHSRPFNNLAYKRRLEKIAWGRK